MKVKCTTPWCGAEGEGTTFAEAADAVDHSVALHRDARGCKGGNDILEVVGGKTEAEPEPKTVKKKK